MYTLTEKQQKKKNRTADDALRCSHEKNVPVCASGELVLCTHHVAFSELRLTGRETQFKK